MEVTREAVLAAPEYAVLQRRELTGNIASDRYVKIYNPDLGAVAWTSMSPSNHRQNVWTGNDMPYQWEQYVLYYPTPHSGQPGWVLHVPYAPGVALDTRVLWQSDEGVTHNGTRAHLPGFVVGLREADRVWTESFPDYVRAFRRECEYSTVRNSIVWDAAQRAIDRMNTPPRRYRVYDWIMSEQEYDKIDSTIPLVIAARNGLFQPGGRMLAGTRSRPEFPATIMEAPEPPWLPTEGTLDDTERIARFKHEAWTVGVQAKRTHQWCGEFENTMRRLGITEDCATPPVPPRAEAAPVASLWNVGDVLTPAQTPALPEGTILEEATDYGGRMAVQFIRDNRSTIPAGTLEYRDRDGRFVHQPGRNYYSGAGMRIVAFPDTPREPVPEEPNGWERFQIGDTVSARQAAEFPHGTVFSWTGGGTFAIYVRDDNLQDMARNDAMTRAVVAGDHGRLLPEYGHYASNMTLVFLPPEGFRRESQR